MTERERGSFVQEFITIPRLLSRWEADICLFSPLSSPFVPRNLINRDSLLLESVFRYPVSRFRQPSVSRFMKEIEKLDEKFCHPFDAISSPPRNDIGGRSACRANFMRD